MTKNIFLFFLSIIVLQSCSNNKIEDKGLQRVLLSSKDQKASCVSYTYDENNLPIASWCENNIDGKKLFFLSFFDKESNSFLSAINIPIEQNCNIHEEGMPKIAIKGDGTIMAVYETSSPTTKNEWAGFVHYIQSFDNGISWTAPLCVHSDTISGKDHSFASISRLSDGEIGACWLDESIDKNKIGRSVRFAKTNGRSGFVNEVLIDSMACDCCRTSINCDPKGNISIVFRDILSDSIRDVSVATSNNNGNSFTKAVSFSNDGWVINGCPHNGPSVISSDKNTYATWFTGGNKKGVYYAELNTNREVVDKRKISANGKSIQLCCLPGGDRVLAYSKSFQLADSFYNKIVINKIIGSKTFEADISGDKSQASYPVISATNESSVAVAWIEDDRVYYKIINTADIIKNNKNSEISNTYTNTYLSEMHLLSKKGPIMECR